MKKIIALVLALIMMASMSVVAFAATFGNAENPETDNKETGVPVTYDVRKGYIVTIPDAFVLDPKDTTDDSGNACTYGIGSGDVKITMARLEGGETLQVSATGTAVAGTGVSTKWVLTDAKADPVGYTIAVSGDGEETTDLAQGDAIIKHVSGTAFNAKDGKTATMSVTTNKTAQAGNFQDTLTFKVEIKTANA